MARRTILQRRIDAALSKLEPEIRNAFIAAMQAQASAVDTRALVAAIEASDLQRAFALLRMDQSVLAPLNEAARAGFIAGGAMVADALPRGIKGSFGFDAWNPRAVEIMRTQTGKLAEILSEDVLSGAREVIAAGKASGQHSSKIALDLVGRVDRRTGMRTGGMIGLNDRQAAAIAKSRSILASGDESAIKALIRARKESGVFPHRQANAALRELAKAGKLSTATIDNFNRQYTNNGLRRRGQTIAKDQVFTAINTGRDEAFAQLIEGGKVDADSITKRWQHNLSNNARADHAAMDGTVVRYNEKFIFADAAMDYAHDPAGGPAHNLNCRCTTSYEIRYI